MNYIKKITDITAYFSELYRDILKIYFTQISTHPLRLIDNYSDPKTGKICFIVQFIGKSVCPHFPADELAADEEILKNFSPIDRKIILLSVRPLSTTKQIGCNQMTLTAITFDRKINKTLYVFKKNEDGVCYEQKFTALELIGNLEILQSLEEEIIKNVALQAGREDVLSFKP